MLDIVSKCRKTAKRKYILVVGRFRKLHHRLGVMQECSHLIYFAVLALESASKSLYAKVGLGCMVLSILYMISEEKDK